MKKTKSAALKQKPQTLIEQIKTIKKYQEEDLIKIFFFTAKQMRICVTKNLKSLDIGFEQAGILFLLQSQGALGVNQIALLFEKDKATISRTIKALEHKNLIEREVTLTDKRSNKIQLSQLGQEKLSQIKDQRNSFAKKMKNAISDEEKEIFIKTLQKILKVTEE